MIMVKRNILSTKANTLINLKSILKKSKIVQLFSFNFHDWKIDEESILNEIQRRFEGKKIIIRSSSLCEDSDDNSGAGQFESIMNIDSKDKNLVQKSIENVFGSYKKKGFSDFRNQVLVQFQIEDITLSGVVFTRGLMNNSPYYIINYDSSGSTDGVTSGLEGNTIKIFKSTPSKEIPEKFKKLLESVKEIEKLTKNDGLDIEFGINKAGGVIIFQVRPLTIKKKDVPEKIIKKHIESLKKKFKQIQKLNKRIPSENKIFADMPDWNPAEILGDTPGLLDFSLYDYIITGGIWHEARISQGYDAGESSKLVVLFGNKPYVDVGSTFSSFIPQGVSTKLKEKLISFYLNKLRENPELQDKVEFDILYTCYDLDFNARSKELLDNGFSQNELNELENALLNLTNNLVKNFEKNIKEDLLSLKKLKKNRKKLRVDYKDSVFSSIKCAKFLLDDCKKNGTVQFSRLARLAFIGKTLLKSLVNQKIIDSDTYESFMESIKTVATEFEEDFELLCNKKISKEKFVKKYYHLRPGTYDITSKRYETNLNLMKSDGNILKNQDKKKFELDKKTILNINRNLEKNGLKFNCTKLFNFIRASIESREFAKFEFTKNLSDAIELFAIAGEEIGFSRRELSYLSARELFSIENFPKKDAGKKLVKRIYRNENLRKINEYLELPPILFSPENFQVVKYYGSNPNYVTRKKISSKIHVLEKGNSNPKDVEGKIILLENGDPGYDWIFTRNPAGLITKYGGVASHMSIRCAEFGLPAAIGCGILFDKLKNKGKIILDCEAKKIIPVEIK